MDKRKLKYCPYGQAYVKVDGYGGITLVSYTTEVVNIDPLGWLTCSGLYSATTHKHISAFMKEYTNLNYQTAKAAYEGKYTINIYTGEIELLGEG